MRNIYVGLAVVLGVAVVFIGGMFFIFGSETIEVFDFRSQESDVRSQDDFGDDDVALDESGNVGGGAGGGVGGDSGGGGGSGGEDVGFVCSRWQPVQYSFGNFFENVECLVYGVGGCERVRAVCGAEVFNLDYELGGIFGVKFFLFSGDDEISLEVIEEDVGARGRVSLRSEVVLDGEFDVGGLRCVVDSGRVPARCMG